MIFAATAAAAAMFGLLVAGPVAAAGYSCASSPTAGFTDCVERNLEDPMQNLHDTVDDFCSSYPASTYPFYDCQCTKYANIKSCYTTYCPGDSATVSTEIDPASTTACAQAAQLKPSISAVVPAPSVTNSAPASAGLTGSAPVLPVPGATGSAPVGVSSSTTAAKSKTGSSAGRASSTGLFVVVLAAVFAF